MWWRRRRRRPGIIIMAIRIARPRKRVIELRKRRWSEVITAILRGKVVISRGRRTRPLSDGELHAELPLRSARRTIEVKRENPRGVTVRVDQAREGEPRRADQGFGDFGGFGVEDLDGERRIGRRCGGERDREDLVPDRAGGAGVVGSGGEAEVRVVVEGEGGVGLEVAVAPVDVLQVLSRYDRDLEVERCGVVHGRWWRRRRSRRRRRRRGNARGVLREGHRY